MSYEELVTDPCTEGLSYPVRGNISAPPLKLECKEEEKG